MHLRLLILFLFFLGQALYAASDPIDALIRQLKLEEAVPDGLLAEKSMVLYASSVTDQDREQIQAGFQRAGIDAVLHYPTDLAFASAEVTHQVIEYLVKREIRYLILARRNGNLLDLVFTPFSGTSAWITPGHSSWQVTGAIVPEMMQSIWRVTSASQKKQNFLIIDIPETYIPLQPIFRERSEFFAFKLNAEKLAVIRSGDDVLDRELESVLQELFPSKIQYFERETPIKEIKAAKCTYVLRNMHTNAVEAMRLMGYATPKNVNALTTISYASGEATPKTMRGNTVVWKFYVQQIDNGAAFLGNRWEAEESASQSLRNHLLTYKAWLNRK